MSTTGAQKARNSKRLSVTKRDSTDSTSIATGIRTSRISTGRSSVLSTVSRGGIEAISTADGGKTKGQAIKQGQLSNQVQVSGKVPNSPARKKDFKDEVESHGSATSKTTIDKIMTTSRISISKRLSSTSSATASTMKDATTSNTAISPTLSTTQQQEVSHEKTMSRDSISIIEHDTMPFDKVTELISEPDMQIEVGLQLIKEAYYGNKANQIRRMFEEQKSAMYEELYRAQQDKNDLQHQLCDIQNRLSIVEKEKASMARELTEARKDVFRRGSTSLLGDHRVTPFKGNNAYDIRSYLGEQSPVERQRLLRMFLESCFPGDISAMQRILSQYINKSVDILSMLPKGLHVDVLKRLSLGDLFSCKLVNHTWYDLVKDSRLWKANCLALTKNDPSPLAPPLTPSGWEELYKGLYFRERNWAEGRVQYITLLKGHTNFVTSIKMRQKRLVTGSYDETLRLWSLEGAEPECLKVIRAKAISCLDFLPEKNVVAGGFHDLGRCLVWSTVTGEILQTMQGHNRGIRALCMNSQYLVSAGQDKAIVAWEWQTGTKRVVFGQQTNLCLGVQLVDSDKIVAITIDGVIRTFDVSTREMLGQFKIPDPSLNLSGAQGLSWFASHGYGTTCGTSRIIYHLEWDEMIDTTMNTIKPNLRSEPKIVDRRVCGADVHVGATDPVKKRVVVATRFTSRSSTAEKNIYVSTIEKGFRKWGGAWTTMSDELARSERNPMAMELDHEKVVVGTSDGTVYICSFVGSKR